MMFKPLKDLNLYGLELVFRHRSGGLEAAGKGNRRLAKKTDDDLETTTTLRGELEARKKETLRPCGRHLVGRRPKL